ncbi:MAG: cupin domain-containing protein [Oscillospiraceae bacterium]|nr:cupin domain-containing protein [Oscillospiraceae bacterium]
MRIDFSAMTEETIPNFLGGEGELHAKMHVDGLNRILHGVLPAGSSIGYHTHETSSEIIYILSGTGKVKAEGGEEPLKAGDCHYCPKGQAHSLINSSGGPLEFFAVVPNQ